MASVFLYDADMQRLIAKIAVYLDDNEPRELCSEFLKFLFVRKGHRMASPSSQIDSLWHRVLLDTVLCEEIYSGFGGGVIHHYPLDDRDLDDREKAVRRLYAMSQMRLLGLKPDLRFWQQAGTLLAKITLVNVNGRDLFAAETTNMADVSRICGMLQYDTNKNKKRKAPAEGTSYSPTSPTYRPTSPNAARTYVPSSPMATDYTIKVRTLTAETVVRVSGDMTVLGLKNAISETQGVPPDQQSLVAFGAVLNDDDARLSDLGILEGETVQLMLKLKGC